ncbi:MAG: hypothetical protein O7G86_15960 [Gammaproteobacteria bacterium]|nr:hypothetical protein [Gammaproteobacteria bacterium]
MDWECYKRLCDQPNYWSRWMLEQTLELLDDAEVSEAIESAMDREPLAKPADHRGGCSTDMFELALTLAEANRVSELVNEAIAGGKTTAGTKNRGFGGFCEAWDEYGRYLSEIRG